MTPFIQELPRHYQRSPQDAELQRVLERMATQAEADKEFALEQLFPSTASGWGLDLWEAAYGLQREPGQTDEQRQGRILAKIKGTGPALPEVIQAIAQCFSSYPVELEEFPAEYRFELWYQGIRPVERLDALRAAVNERKPAHLDWSVHYREAHATEIYAGLAPREAESFILRQRALQWPRYTVPVYEGALLRNCETFILRQEE